MDDSLGHLDTNQFFLTDEKIVGLVNSEEPAPLSTPSAHSNAHSSPTKGTSPRTDRILPAGQQLARTSRSLEVNHASPLAPLRSRDSHALDAMFEHDHLPEITLDIHRYLARTYPEPCWEDEPYEFLNGYI